MKNKDWVGNKKSIYVTLGASNHTKEERQNLDYYATDPKVIDYLLELEDFNDILEPACGEGHLSKALRKHGKRVKSSDIVYRGYGKQKDFFDIRQWSGDIITNPPYKFAEEFVRHSLNIIPEGRKVAMFLKLQFLEGKKRKKLFSNYPPKTVYVSSSRIVCAKNGDFNKIKSSAVAYTWFVWHKGFSGNTIIKWFN